MLGEHEATVSRQLARTRRLMRDAIEHDLRARHGFDDHAVAWCFQSAAEDPGSLDLRQVLGAPAERKIAAAERSK
jgi:hypothetical protein